MIKHSTTLYYHPPDPKYELITLQQRLSADLDSISKLEEESITILAGDFNRLPDSFFAVMGLHKEFNEATRMGHCLDRLYSSEPTYTNCRAIASSVKSDHLAVVAYQSASDLTFAPTTRTSHLIRRRDPSMKAKFLSALSDETWSSVTDNDDCDAVFSVFFHTAYNIPRQLLPGIHNYYVIKRSIFYYSCDPCVVKKKESSHAERQDSPG